MRGRSFVRSEGCFTQEIPLHQLSELCLGKVLTLPGAAGHFKLDVLGVDAAIFSRAQSKSCGGFIVWLLRGPAK